MEGEKILQLEAEIKKLKHKLEERENEEAIKDRQDQYRLSKVGNKLLSQEIHGNLKGLASDDHAHYLNNSRHDTTARHGSSVIGGPYEPSFTKNAAFNKNFGTGEGTVCEGNDSRLSDNRDPNAHDLIDTTGHPVSGLTTGHFLKATGEDTYAFGPHGLTAGDVGALAKQSGSLPAATEGNRGQFFTVEGGTGVADQVYVCIKDDNDDYVWQQII